MLTSLLDLGCMIGGGFFLVVGLVSFFSRCLTAIRNADFRDILLELGAIFIGWAMLSAPFVGRSGLALSATAILRDIGLSLGLMCLGCTWLLVLLLCLDGIQAREPIEYAAVSYLLLAPPMAYAVFTHTSLLGMSIVAPAAAVAAFMFFVEGCWISPSEQLEESIA